jgi:hypothetical protein
MNKLNCCAHNITRPVIARNPWYNKGITHILDNNRKGIAKLRKRRFTWTQIHATLIRMGIDVDYNNLYQWQLRRFKQ